MSIFDVWYVCTLDTHREVLKTLEQKSNGYVRPVGQQRLRRYIFGNNRATSDFGRDQLDLARPMRYY